MHPFVKFKMDGYMASKLVDLLRRNEKLAKKRKTLIEESSYIYIYTSNIKLYFRIDHITNLVLQMISNLLLGFVFGIF